MLLLIPSNPSNLDTTVLKKTIKILQLLNASFRDTVFILTLAFLDPTVVRGHGLGLCLSFLRM